MEPKEWYMEYEIHENRPGLLGDISSLLGMLSINIVTINGVENSRRGMLIRSRQDDSVVRLRSIMETIDTITLRKIREPRLRDRLAVMHGRYIERDADDKKTFRFVRDELGLLVDFIAELFKKDRHYLVGIRGMPRVGKTESLVASKRMRQQALDIYIVHSSTPDGKKPSGEDEKGEGHIYIIDGIVSMMRAPQKHRDLVDQVMKLPSVKVVEHPDIFIRESHYTIQDFDCIIELRNDESQVITYDVVDSGFSSFDIS